MALRDCGHYWGAWAAVGWCLRYSVGSIGRRMPFQTGITALFTGARQMKSYRVLMVYSVFLVGSKAIQ